MTITNDRTDTDKVVPADWIPGPRQGEWTYAHYALIPDDGNRYEIIDGVLYMSPGPNESHQRANSRIVMFLGNHIELTGLGRVYTTPFDVELGPHLVVEPDVLVILNANLHKIVEARIIGAPDLVVEILSPGTALRDRKKKRAAYASAGVREYWLVEPKLYTVEVLVLEAGAYRSIGVYSGRQTLPSVVVPNFPIQVQQFFG